MPLVRPEYKTNTGTYVKIKLVPGRYVLKVVESKESDKLDKNGNNALVVKFEVVNNRNTGFNGNRISRWFSLGGAGAKALYRFMMAIDPNYAGGPFTTESLVGKLIEADVVLETSPKDGKEWAKLEKVYPYLQPGTVGNTFAANVTAERDVPNFNDFDS